MQALRPRRPHAQLTPRASHRGPASGPAPASSWSPASRGGPHSNWRHVCILCPCPTRPQSCGPHTLPPALSSTHGLPCRGPHSPSASAPSAGAWLPTGLGPSSTAPAPRPLVPQRLHPGRGTYSEGPPYQPSASATASPQGGTPDPAPGSPQDQLHCGPCLPGLSLIPVAHIRPLPIGNAVADSRPPASPVPGLPVYSPSGCPRPGTRVSGCPLCPTASTGPYFFGRSGPGLGAWRAPHSWLPLRLKSHSPMSLHFAWWPHPAAPREPSQAPAQRLGAPQAAVGGARGTPVPGAGAPARGRWTRADLPARPGPHASRPPRCAGPWPPLVSGSPTAARWGPEAGVATAAGLRHPATVYRPRFSARKLQGCLPDPLL